MVISKLTVGGYRVTSHGHAALFCLVFFSDAVRRNALTKDSTEKEIELLITMWLQLASDRDGGRSQRANRQTV